MDARNQRSQPKQRTLGVEQWTEEERAAVLGIGEILLRGAQRARAAAECSAAGGPREKVA